MLLWLNTSCWCTTAQVITPNGKSPVYQMAWHWKPVKWRWELNSWEEWKIVVYYDPSIHPKFTWDAIREVYININDPKNFQQTLKVFLNQII